MKEIKQNPLLSIGSIWKDLDPRCNSERLIKVISVEYKFNTVHCQDLSRRSNGRWTFTAKISRFNGHKNGYGFVRSKE